MDYLTDQENFWAGEFGNEYINRNQSSALLNSKVAMWSQMMKSANRVKTIKELGCNIGLNLEALHRLNPSCGLSGVEINKLAADQARGLNVASISCDTITEPLLNQDVVDLTFTAAVLIHINPEKIQEVYKNLVNLSNRYVLVAEYYNPTPTDVTYRGHTKRLFKRDFAGDLMEDYGLHLVDYGFFYKGEIT